MRTESPTCGADWTNDDEARPEDARAERYRRRALPITANRRDDMELETAYAIVANPAEKASMSDRYLEARSVVANARHDRDQAYRRKMRGLVSVAVNPATIEDDFDGDPADHVSVTF